MSKCIWCGLPEDYTKEKTCSCCGKPFTAKHQKPKSVAGCFVGQCTLPKFCDRCLKQIEATKWFTHHRKEPTSKELEKEIRKLL
jgi:hypothetical protein